jgi:hypothetical protein
MPTRPAPSPHHPPWWRCPPSSSCVCRADLYRRRERRDAARSGRCGRSSRSRRSASKFEAAARQGTLSRSAHRPRGCWATVSWRSLCRSPSRQDAFAGATGECSPPAPLVISSRASGNTPFNSRMNSRREMVSASVGRLRQTRTTHDARALESPFKPSVFSVLIGHVPESRKPECKTASRKPVNAASQRLNFFSRQSGWYLQRVRQALRETPIGSTASYQEIARKVEMSRA